MPLKVLLLAKTYYQQLFFFINSSYYIWIVNSAKVHTFTPLKNRVGYFHSRLFFCEDRIKHNKNACRYLQAFNFL